MPARIWHRAPASGVRFELRWGRSAGVPYVLTETATLSEIELRVARMVMASPTVAPLLDQAPNVRKLLWWPKTPAVSDSDGVHPIGIGFCPPTARRMGIETVLTPVRAPQANATAERVIRTIRQECLDHVIVLNERHLRRLLGEFVPYYNRSRPHRSLHLDPPDGSRVRVRPAGARLTSRPVLGGLHHVYEWAA